MIRNYVKKYEAWQDLDPDEIELEPGTRKPSEKVLDQLFNDIRNDNLQGVKDYISCDYDPDSKDEIGNTPLIYACKHNKIKIAEYLIKNGANINEKNKDNETALLIACQDNNDDVVELLLKNGAIVNNDDVENPLIYACKNNNKEIVEILLRNKVDINNILLDVLQQYNLDEDIIDLLLIYGANINVKTDTGHSILDILYNTRRYLHYFKAYRTMKNLIELGLTPTMKMLFDLIYDNGFNDLKEKIEFAKKIINRDDIDVDEIVNEIYNDTILNYIASLDEYEDEDYDFISFLIKKGADINHRGMNGYSPLRIAVNNDANDNKEEIVEFLLKNGADANTRDSYNATPLISTDDLDICQLLLDYGADINAQDKSGNTALHYATCSYANPNGNYELVKFLLEAGADTSITNKKGMTPPELAKNWNIEQLYFGDDYDDEEDYDDDEDYDNEEY